MRRQNDELPLDHPDRPDPPVVTHNPDGTLARAGALIEARNRYGENGTISSTDEPDKMVWCIGQFQSTVGRGQTWEQALRYARPARPTRVETD